jgi:pilus assembly protein Flp/PilA
VAAETLVTALPLRIFRRRTFATSRSVMSRFVNVFFNAPTEEPMNKLCKNVRRFLVSEDGPTAVEYAVMLALIVIVCLAAIRTLGTNSKTTFTNIANSLGS